MHIHIYMLSFVTYTLTDMHMDILFLINNIRSFYLRFSGNRAKTIELAKRFLDSEEGKKAASLLERRHLTSGDLGEGQYVNSIWGFGIWGCLGDVSHLRFTFLLA